MHPIEHIKKSMKNKSIVEQSQSCGCYKCFDVFDSKKVTEWTFDDSAICPFCKMDTVIPNIKDVDLQTIKNFLTEGI